MEQETIDAQDWQTKATACEMLAFSFRYPGKELAEALTGGEWADAAREIAQAFDVELPQEFGKRDVFSASNESLDGEALLHALRAEATHMFVGAPKPTVSPYEGIWRAQDDGVEGLLFVNPHSMAVERFAKSCGLGRPEGTNEPLDHAATELELLQVLALWCAEDPSQPFEHVVPLDQLPGGSPQAAYSQFMSEHVLTWMPRFAKSVQEESRIPYYKDAAVLLEGLLGKLS